MPAVGDAARRVATCGPCDGSVATYAADDLWPADSQIATGTPMARAAHPAMTGIQTRRGIGEATSRRVRTCMTCSGYRRGPAGPGTVEHGVSVVLPVCHNTGGRTCLPWSVR